MHVNTHQPDLPTADALDRYLAGVASPDDAERIERWIARAPDRAVALAALQSMRDRPWPASWDVNAGWREFIAAIGASTPASPKRSRDMTQSTPLSRVRSSWMGRLVTGAALAAILVLGFVVRPWKPASVRTTIPPAGHVYVTHRGEQAKIALPDGSSVVLGPETRVHFTEDASTRMRIARVDGEAYFTVAMEAARPFVVRTAHVTARVLGTAFSVREYAVDPAARVVVASGKVAVRGDSTAAAQDVIATAHTIVQVGDSGRLTVQHDASLDDELAWVTGRLVFRNTPVSTVVTELERRYDVIIQFTDTSLVNDRITALLDSETPREALENLAIALNARYTQSGRVATFSPIRRVLRHVPLRSSHPSEPQYGR